MRANGTRCMLCRPSRNAVQPATRVDVDVGLLLIGETSVASSSLERAFKSQWEAQLAHIDKTWGPCAQDRLCSPLLAGGCLTRSALLRWAASSGTLLDLSARAGALGRELAANGKILLPHPLASVNLCMPALHGGSGMC